MKTKDELKGYIETTGIYLKNLCKELAELEQETVLTDEKLIEIMDFHWRLYPGEATTDGMINAIKKNVVGEIYKRLAAEFVIRAVIEYYNDGWWPDWEDLEQDKRIFYYNKKFNEVGIDDYTNLKHIGNHMYINSFEDAIKVKDFCKDFHGVNLWHWYFEIEE